jgi:hypothetical protein
MQNGSVKSDAPGVRRINVQRVTIPRLTMNKREVRRAADVDFAVRGAVWRLRQLMRGIS